MPKITIDRETCEECGDCVEACPVPGVLEVFEGVPIVNDEDSCTLCGLCEKACPTDSIKAETL